MWMGAHLGVRLEARQRHAVEGRLAGRLVGRRHAQHALQAARLELLRQVVDGLVHLLMVGQAAVISLWRRIRGAHSGSAWPSCQNLMILCGAVPPSLTVCVIKVKLREGMQQMARTISPVPRPTTFPLRTWRSTANSAVSLRGH